MPKISSKPVMTKKMAALINKRKGIHLDLGCADQKKLGWVGIDIRKLPGVDIVHDLEVVPYPLPDDCCSSVLASHIFEHISPAKFGFFNVMQEIWRIMKPGGRLMIAMPYGVGHGYVQDPTHCNPCNETTWGYFDPNHTSGLWGIYRPHPWRIVANTWASNGFMEVILEKMSEAKKDVA